MVLNTNIVKLKYFYFYNKIKNFIKMITTRNQVKMFYVLRHKRIFTSYFKIMKNCLNYNNKFVFVEKNVKKSDDNIKL